LADLRATVIIDYQNVYDTGTGVFGSSLIPGTGFVHPLRYADELIRIRNQSQPMATLSKVLVYRGLPHSAHEPRKNAWNKAQKSEWMRDSRVEVTHRDLKYDYQRDTQGKPLLDAKGTRIVIWPPREKGIDVHCALALIRESLNPEVDLVILCTQDTDLVPALDEACRMGAAKVETASWYDRRQNRRNFPIHPTNSSTVWNTELGYANFFASLDPKVYRSR
jgi:hypothetical protein